VKPEGFLTPDELFALDSVVDPALTPTGEGSDVASAGDDLSGSAISDNTPAFSTNTTLDSASSIQ
jgi:hypothetical protein